MKRAFLKVTALFLTVYAGAGLVTNSQTSNKPTTADVKIRQRMSMGAGAATETVLYIKGQRMRNEMAGGGMGFTTILQCDLKRTLTINEKTKTYMVSSTDRPNTATGDGGATGVTPPPQNNQTSVRGGIVNVTNTITDTGERKEMFGFTARHIKTSMVKKASPDACDKDMKVETDGWYIDFQYAFECPGQTQKTPTPPVHTQPGCRDDVRTRTIGSAKLGFPLLVTTTIYQPDGRTSTMTQEVLELSRESLSASLFDVPEGYALAKDMQELYGMGSVATSTPNRPSANSSSESASQPNSTNTMTTPSAEKKPGVLRIGLVMPKVQMSAGNAAQTAEAVRNGFAQYLQGPSIEVMPLTATMASSVIEEARQKQCDYVLYVSMTVKKGGGGGMFGRAIGNIAGSAAGHIPGGGSAATGAARSAVLTGVYTTAAIAANIKAKDELSLEYKLDKTENASTVLTNTGKAKAKSDGDDILTPVIESAAQTIVSTIRR
ncbi:MAG TPA: hypothetical protein VFP64_01910 [Pyrinomonadaceae bacterium]|nr:hypothetical protein [Pyrinomonadaceae bacterium]